MTRLTLATTLVFAIAAAPLAAKPHLREVKEINDGLLAVGIANVIRKNCPTIEARELRGKLYLLKLANRARSMGYSRSEIEAYVDDKAEKARMEALGIAYMKDKGVRRGDPETFCALGREEIDRSSRIGAFLRAK